MASTVGNSLSIDIRVFPPPISSTTPTRPPPCSCRWRSRRTGRRSPLRELDLEIPGSAPEGLHPHADHALTTGFLLEGPHELSDPGRRGGTSDLEQTFPKVWRQVLDLVQDLRYELLRAQTLHRSSVTRYGAHVAGRERTRRPIASPPIVRVLQEVGARRLVQPPSWCKVWCKSRAAGSATSTEGRLDLQVL
jgi:hypothetical protein